jgi:hypothetical protein
VMKFTWQAPWLKKPIQWKDTKAGTIFRVGLSCYTPAPDIFKGGDFTADEKSIIRWYQITKYPKGVSLEQGEDWFLNVHTKEVLQQPGLTAYFSSRACTMPGRYPVEWVRVTEQWYEDFNGWKKSVIDFSAEVYQTALGKIRQISVPRTLRRFYQHLHTGTPRP